MFGETELYNALNVSSITGLLSTFDSDPALWADEVVPSTFTGSDSINFSFAVPFDSAAEVEIYSYILNCRSNTRKANVGLNTSGSVNIAYAVQEEINRKSYGTYFITTSVGPTIPPEDSNDNYNTPVTVTLKLRG